MKLPVTSSAAAQNWHRKYTRNDMIMWPGQSTGICREQPRSQGLSCYCPVERATRDPGTRWSRATLTIENIREGSCGIRQLVALGFVDRIQLSRCAAAPHPRWLLILSFQAENANIIYSNVYLKVKQVCLEAIYCDHLMLLPSYPLYLRKGCHISAVEVEQRTFLPH